MTLQSAAVPVTPPARPNEQARHGLIITLAATIVAALIWFGLEGVSREIRLVFITFAVAIIGWVFTKIEDSYIALVAATVFVLAGIETPDGFFEALGDSLVWLLVAAFIIAAAIKTSGLADRLAAAVAVRARSVSQLFYALTAVIVATAFFIPSTSGRAAVMLPVFLALAAVIPQRRIVTALALLFPTAILLSAIASLIGAGAHLITADILSSMTGQRIDFLRWMVLGLPFALISCFASTWVILRLFLDREERGQALSLSREAMLASSEAPRSSGLSGHERYVLAVALAVVALWVTEPLHTINNTVVAIIGALAVTARSFGPITLKQGIKSVEWNLILFMAATLELSEGLVDSGAAAWLMDGAFAALQGAGEQRWLVFAAVSAIALLSHLLVASRSARAAILVPMVVMLALALGYNPAAVAFVAVAATGFCLTLTVSAKPVALFSDLDVPTYTARDLLRLSAVLLPLHFVLLMVFAFGVWPQLGLPMGSLIPAMPVWQ
jgi:anion transporter